MLTVAILAGGLASRLKPITEVIPKSLVTINHKPFIEWQLNLLAKRGITKVVLCLGYKAEMIKDFVGNGSKFNLDVKYFFDGDEQLGTGGAIKNALPALENEFMVLYGDSYLNIDYAKATEAYKRSSLPAMMTIYKNEGKYDKSNIKIKNDEGIEYKKVNNGFGYSHIDYGLSFFERDVFEMSNFGTKFDLSQICENLSGRNLLAGFEVYDRFYEVGSHSGIQDLTQHLKRNGYDIY